MTERDVLARAAALAADYVESLDTRSVGARSNRSRPSRQPALHSIGRAGGVPPALRDARVTAPNDALIFSTNNQPRKDARMSLDTALAKAQQFPLQLSIEPTE